MVSAAWYNAWITLPWQYWYNVITTTFQKSALDCSLCKQGRNRTLSHSAMTSHWIESHPSLSSHSKKLKITIYCLGVLEKPLVKGHLKCRCAQLEPDSRLMSKAAWLLCLFLNSYFSKTGLGLASPTPSGTQGPGASWSMKWSPRSLEPKPHPRVPHYPSAQGLAGDGTHGLAEGWKLSHGFPNKGLILHLFPMLTPPFPELLQACLLINHKLSLIMETKSHYQGMHVKQGVSYYTCIKLQPLPPNFSWHSI